MIKAISFLTLLFLAATVPDAVCKTAPATDSSSTVQVIANLDYLDAGRSEKLDIFLPPDATLGEPKPGVVFLHGGGFRREDKAQPGPASSCRVLAENGFVVANINYALAKKPNWPLPVLDGKNAVRFLRANAVKYHVDPNRISIMGTSAGGQLALLVALTSGVAALEPPSPYPGVSAAVNAVVNFYGGTDFVTRKKPDANGQPTSEPYYLTASTLLGSKEPSDNPELWAAASPVTYVRPEVPPVLTVHGKRDRVVDYFQAIELAAALDRNRVPNKLILLGNAGHSFPLDTKRKTGDGITVLKEVVDFLKSAPPRRIQAVSRRE